MLGAIDYYNSKNINAFQIVPIDDNHKTIDIPDMSLPWSKQDEIWKYLKDNLNWEFSISENAIAITNLKALYGFRLTEFYRFEEDEWEIFSGNGSLESKESIRIVPITVLLKGDPTIRDFLNLEVGMGKFRDLNNESNQNWYDWS
jgi:hypothetical protein